MHRWFVLFYIVGLLSTRTTAQTVSPVIVEYAQKAEGSFVVRNDSMAPFTVVLEPRSFSVTEEGDPAYRLLDPSISVSLSAKSFRVAPHRAYTVYYRAQSRQLPAWFTIYASIAPPTVAGAVHLVIELPHTVYLLSRTPLRAGRVTFSRSEIAPDGRYVEAVLENHAAEFERVQEVELIGPSGKQTYAGFPFFPDQRRMLHLEWNGRGAAEKIVVKFSKFKVESTLHRSSSGL